MKQYVKIFILCAASFPAVACAQAGVSVENRNVADRAFVVDLNCPTLRVSGAAFMEILLKGVEENTGTIFFDPSKPQTGLLEQETKRIEAVQKMMEAEFQAATREEIDYCNFGSSQIAQKTQVGLLLTEVEQQ